MGLLGNSAGGGGSGGGGSGSGDVLSSAPVFVGAEVLTANAMAALAIDVTKALNTKTIAIDSTFTFSGTPATVNTWFTLCITNSDTNSHVATIPSSYPEASAVPITTVTVPASAKIYLTWRYDGTIYQIFGSGVVPTSSGVSKSAAYTTTASDANGIIVHPASDANARTFTIDSNANVPYDLYTAITFINRTANVVTIAITSDTMTLAGTTTTGSRSLAQNGIATAIKDTATGWIINGTGLT